MGPLIGAFGSRESGAATVRDMRSDFHPRVTSGALCELEVNTACFACLPKRTLWHLHECGACSAMSAREVGRYDGTELLAAS